MEFALLAPVLVILLFGSAEVLRAIRARMLLTQAVSMTADVVAAQFKAIAAPACGAGTPTPTCTIASMQDFCQGAKLILSPTLRTSFSLTIVNITYTSTNTSNPYAILWQDINACSTPGSVYALPAPVNPSSVPFSLLTTQHPTVILLIGSINYTPPALTVQPIVNESINFTYTKYVNPRNTSLPCFNSSNSPCKLAATTAVVTNE